MSDAQTQIDQLVKSNDIVLFMKGNASFPMCGFSGRAIQILKACGVDTKTVKTVNVLEDEGIRQGIKTYCTSRANCSRSSTARPEAPSPPCPATSGWLSVFWRVLIS